VANEVRAQVSFTMTLMEDGSLLLSESGVQHDPQSGSKLRYSAWHEIEGTCHPEELAYTMWAEMERHV